MAMKKLWEGVQAQDCPEQSAGRRWISCAWAALRGGILSCCAHDRGVQHVLLLGVVCVLSQDDRAVYVNVAFLFPDLPSLALVPFPGLC